MLRSATKRVVRWIRRAVVDIFFGVSAVRVVPAAVCGCAEKMRPIEMY